MANPKCSARNGRGEPCGRYAVTGATVCPAHGGRAPQVKAAAARRIEEEAAQAAVVTLGLPRDISPTEALLEEVRWTAGHVHWLRGKVQELEQEALTWGTTGEVTKTATEFPGTDTTKEAVPNVWYVLYDRERKHLVQVASAALKAGVEERRVRLAEAQGDLVATVIRRILDALNLTAEQQAMVSTVVPAQLRLLAGGAA